MSKTVLEQIREDIRDDEQPWRAMATAYYVAAKLCRMDIGSVLDHLGNGREDLARKTAGMAVARLLEVERANTVLFEEGLGLRPPGQD